MFSFLVSAYGQVDTLCSSLLVLILLQVVPHHLIEERNDEVEDH